MSKFKQMQPEEKLRESEETFRTIFDAATDGILLAGMEDKKFYLGNRALCQMIGYNQEEIRNLGVMEIHPEEDLPYVIEQFEKQSRGEITIAKDIPVKRKDGSLFYADIGSVPITLSGRTYLMGIFRDNTERRRVEEALRESEERFRTIVDASKDGMIAIDREGAITIFNPAAERIFGHRREEMIGQPLDCLMPEEYREQHRQYVKGYFTTGEPNNAIGKTVELPAFRSDGTIFPIELSLSTGQFGDEQFALAIIRDITEHKRAEEELKESRDELAVQKAELEESNLKLTEQAKVLEEHRRLQETHSEFLRLLNSIDTSFIADNSL